MSAIAGLVMTDGQFAGQQQLARMVDSVPGLGPDGGWMRCDGPAGLIQLSLATTPEALVQTEICVSSSTGASIVFDGRLDNRGDLIALIAEHAGKLPLSGRPDGELALALFDNFGDEALQKFVGDFSLAVWTPAARRLLCARSPLGWRPFLWTRTKDKFAFASEPAMLVKGLWLDRNFDEGVLGELLGSRFVTQTQSLVKNIERLPPGSALSFQNGNIQRWHWHTEKFDADFDMPEAVAVDRFNELFDQALVAMHRSNGPLHAHVSGGLDSSSVACRSAQLYQAGKLEKSLNLVSARFPGQIHDESAWSSQVEKQLGARAAVVRESDWDIDGAAQWSADTLHLPVRPNAGAVFVPTFEHMHNTGGRVLLTGEGGDDWLAGSIANWPDLLLRGRWAALLKEGLNRDTRPLHRRLLTTLSASLGPVVFPARRNQLLYPHLDMSRRLPEWIQPEWGKKIDLIDRQMRETAPRRFSNFAQSSRYGRFVAARTYPNVENLLAAAERHHVELRHPFHDRRLTHFLMGVPGSLLLKGATKKYLLRQAMRGTLPESIRTRQDKGNISSPIITGADRYLAQRPMRQLLPVQLGWVQADVLEQYHQVYCQWRDRGRADNPPLVHYNAVWMTVSVDIWLRHALGMG